MTQYLRQTSGRVAIVWTLLGTLLSVFTACLEINTSPHMVAAVALDSMAAPSVVAGDTLRDTLGVARPLHGVAYNTRGAVLTGVPIRYRILDPGAHVDSITGIVVGDSVSATPVRVVVDVGGLQTEPTSLFVVPPPDTIVAQQVMDTLLYAVQDSISQSAALTIQLLHHASPTLLDFVQAYSVSFAIQPAMATPFAQLQLVDDAGRPSNVDTTASDGTASRHVRLRLLTLPAPADSTDSVVVSATARYHGVPVAGSPVQIVVRLRRAP